MKTPNNNPDNKPDNCPPPKKRYFAPWEKSFDRVVTPFDEFIHDETTGSIFLMVCTVAALILTNSDMAEAYSKLFHAYAGIVVGDWSLKMSLSHWINDGLMALFFFVAGLEIKREILVGELATPKRAALPIAAAVGGMIAPALIYFAINPEGAGAQGWAIPMATDIAFAVGILVMLGSRIPKTLVMFLVAMAIVDDLGGVLVIAIFYTEQIAGGYLAATAVIYLLLWGLNLSGVRKCSPYFILGALLWYTMLNSGIHATIAGILLASTIPARPQYEPRRFSERVRDLMARFNKSHHQECNSYTNEEQRSILQTLENTIHSAETPLQRLEHSFHLPVAILIVPIFALANAGIPISFGTLGDTLSQPVALGVICGLIIGKLVGILSACWITLKFGIGRLPSGARFSDLIGIALLGGVGFTMSIFIAELGFAGSAEYLLQAKTGIITASFIGGVSGYLWFIVTRRKQDTTS
ncbi:MAG: Na+/H+ antiporter NhaA [Gammaproteobacteria bacterium]|nr:Na+/H+ antiporter NhaA [Gammaproteobacteria bacterium]